MKHHRSRGFSLIEIIVAISILATLCGVLAPQIERYTRRARIQSVVEDFKAIQLGMNRYFGDVGSYQPLNDIAGFSAEQGSEAFQHFISGDGSISWNGPYMRTIKAESALGGKYDIDVIDSDSATIELGTREQLGANYEELLDRLNDVLDGDGDTRTGVVWGDASGIHYGQNHSKR